MINIAICDDDLVFASKIEEMNTVIEKNDGSYWICGEGVGTEQKTVSGETEYTVTCSSKFVPYEFPANEFSK